MIYPDVYEVGLPNQGIAILYNILNQPRAFPASAAMCRGPIWRCHARGWYPAAVARGRSTRASFDIVGMHVPHEMAVTNFLEALDLAGIPLLAADRTEDDPIIIAGGPSVYNPEPYAAFFDAILIGEARSRCSRFASCIAACATRASRALRLSSSSRRSVAPMCRRSTRCAMTSPARRMATPCRAKARTSHRRSTSASLRTLALPIRCRSRACYAQLVHDRLSIEILRGCARGCRFCQAGMTYRPVRERSADQIVSSVIQGLEKTGYDEVSLTSLSTTDHSCIRDVLGRLNRRLEDTGIRVSIPSQRLDSFGVDMAESVAGEKKGGLTFAPEAGSQRMRDIINKNVTEEDLDRAAKAAFEAGWNRMKLYFMMGLPGERDEDIVAIANLADHVLELGRSVVPKARRGSISVSISVSVFIPKPPRRSNGARSSITMTSSVAKSCSSRACATAPYACTTTMPRPRSLRPRCLAPAVT